MNELFKKARFIESAPSLSTFKGAYKPCVLFVGRSNVGKSTLINTLLGQKLAFVSKKAGKTKSLNFFLIDEKFYLLDSPGYGSTSFATMSTVQFSSLMEETLPNPLVKAICLLLDFRHEPNSGDKAFYQWILSFKKPVIVILTKTDQMNQSELAKAKKWCEELGFSRVIESDIKGCGKEKIVKAIAANL